MGVRNGGMVWNFGFDMLDLHDVASALTVTLRGCGGTRLRTPDVGISPDGTEFAIMVGSCISCRRKLREAVGRQKRYALESWRLAAHTRTPRSTPAQHRRTSILIPSRSPYLLVPATGTLAESCALRKLRELH
jgi:hypothetical protein